jgi:radical SAM superfamily enzyme YgiQ (UPF0313 family)
MFSRIDHLNESKIRMLSKSGCAILRIGVEAGNDNIRNEIYKKRISKSQIEKTFELCKRHGIATTAYYMLGGPSESRSTINETISFSRKINADRSAFFIFKPFTDEGMRLVRKYGGEIDIKRWEKADNISFDAVVKLKDITPTHIEMLQKKAYFYTFGKRWASMITSSPISYTWNLMKYMSKGIKDGLDAKYLIMYYHIYGYGYVKR